MKGEHKIILGSFLVGLAVTFADAVIDTAFFYDAPLLDSSLFDITPFELYFRSLILITFTGYGAIASRFYAGRKRMELELQHREGRYRSLFEESPISLWEEDFYKVKRKIDELKGEGIRDFRKYFNKNPGVVKEFMPLVKIVDVNEATLELYGAKSKKELLGSLDKIFVDETCNVFKEELIAIAGGKKVFESEIMGRTLGKEKRDLALKWEVAAGYEETLSRVLVSIVDITDRKRAGEELQRYAARLEEANRLKDLFTDIMRHDIMNPVGVIKNVAELMQSEDMSTEARAELAMIEESVRRIEELALTSAELAKVESVEELSFEELDLAAAVREVIKSLEPLADKNGIELAFDFEGECRAEANSTIEDVFLNLISNAIKYSPPGGKVEVSVASKRGSWRFEVRDRGEGIPDRYKEDVFLRFYRADRRGVVGTGLGLAIVKRVVDLHGGKVGVDDNPGGGSIFYFAVPKRQKGR